MVPPLITERIICEHESAHAVMRWIRGERATRIVANSDGGFTEGTGKTIRAEDLLLVTLAGFAFEYLSAPALSRVDFANCKGGDFDDARSILAGSHYLRLNVRTGPDGKSEPIEETVDQALARFFCRAVSLMLHNRQVVMNLADHLEKKGQLSARSVAAILRNHSQEYNDRMLPEELSIAMQPPEEHE